MNTVPQTPATRERLNELVAELFGDQPAPAPLNTAGERWQQAVTQVGEQLRAKLRVEVLPERMHKALEFVHANAVTLQADGTARVQSGKQTYTLAPDCHCADAKHRSELCKHALAVELHRRAVALFHGSTAEPTPPAESVPAPAAPSPSPAAASAAPPAALPPVPSAPAAALWGTTEAPASCNIKLRVGHMELWYTARDVDDATLQHRLQGVLPWLQDVLGACEADYAARVAARDAAPAAPVPQAPPPAPPLPPAAASQLDVQTLVHQAIQQALAAQANGQAPGMPPPAPPSTGTAPSAPAPDDQQTGFCSLHQAAMEQKHNERGTFYGHWLADEQRHCNGRRNGRR
jgi:hypothetical protein